MTTVCQKNTMVFLVSQNYVFANQQSQRSNSIFELTFHFNWLWLSNCMYDQKEDLVKIRLFINITIIVHFPIPYVFIISILDIDQAHEKGLNNYVDLS